VLSAEGQLDTISTRLLATGGVPLLPPESEARSGDTRGILDVRLGYPNGYQFDVTVFLDVSRGHPEWVWYAFHLRDEQGRCVFRYDNAPHHPGVRTFPHHKHVGPDEAPQAHPRPSLRQILREVTRATAS
jgi:hypothetical protein